MSEKALFGLGTNLPARTGMDAHQLVVVQRPLRRVLAFTGRTIDDVINDPVARNQVRGYYKLHCWIRRESEISELERQWNSI
jgi:hypothetical protein